MKYENIDFNKKIKAVFIDFDGTLAHDNREVSDLDRQTLKHLGEIGVIRVLATGRSLWACHRVLEPDFPIDFLVFSSGSGIFDFHTKTIIHSVDLPEFHAREIAHSLLEKHIDFKLIKPIPHNEQFVFYPSPKPTADILYRAKIYADHRLPDIAVDDFGPVGQILAIFPPNGNTFEMLCNKFSDVSIIRATSPLDGISIWAEFFRKGVSKAYGAEYLCNKLGIKPIETMAVGNDYNDIALLDFTPNAFVVENAPDILKQKYSVVKSNNNSGVSDAVNIMLFQK